MRLLGVKRPRVKRDFCPEAIDVTWCGDISYINTFPVVWGISATITRFEDAMKGVTDRSPPERVEVDIDKVRASGLVKDEIGVDEPDEAGTFSTTLLREAVKATLDYERRWAAYSADQDEPEVMPVLVVQVPDKASVAKLSELIDVIESEWPGLGPNAIAHVFGEHERRYVGGRAVDRVRPVSIQNDTDVRVVLAKQAISTGWDCPRAEVLYSERPARDVMYIAQIIGRMVRSPLTHRVTTDDALNSVACFLLLFDRSALEDIKAELEGRGTTQGELRVGAAMVRAPKVHRKCLKTTRRSTLPRSTSSASCPHCPLQTRSRTQYAAPSNSDSSFRIRNDIVKCYDSDGRLVSRNGLPVGD